MRIPDPKSILITGASSGIGEALARAYAGPGVFLALGGRDGTRLAAVAHACRAAGAEVTADTVDVTDGPAMDAWIAALDATSPMDLVIANAGVTTDTTGETGDADRLAAITEVNVNGVWHTLAPAIPLMQARGRGQIALMSSVAAYRGLPSAPAYSASKAWVKALGEALRGTLYGDGITVSVICPGFVESRITATNPFPMPLFMDARRAAGIIKRGLTRGKALIAFPWRLHALLWLLAALPPGLTDPLFRKMPRKE